AGEDERLVDGSEVRGQARPRVLDLRTAVDLRNAVDEPLVVRAVPGLVELELLVQRLLADVRQEGHAPAQQRLAVLGVEGVRWQSPRCVVVIVEGDEDLLEASTPA